MTGGIKRKQLNTNNIMTILLSLLTEEQKKRYSIKIENSVWYHAYGHGGERGESTLSIFVLDQQDDKRHLMLYFNKVEELIEKFKQYINGSYTDRSKEDA